MAFCSVTFTEEKRQFEINPTVVPVKDFDPETDAKCLYDAMKGFGTNEKKIINIVANRSSAQLIVVEKKFATLYGEDLKKMLKKELGGKLEEVVLGRFYDRWQYQAYICRNAMKGMGTDEQALVDVLCTKSAEDMKKVKSAYEELYQRDLLKDVKSEVGGNTGRLLYSLVTAGRETEDKDPDIVLARAEAKALYDAGEGQWGTDEKIFNNIFANRSFKQLRLMFLCYRQLANKLIFEAIEKEMSGTLKSAFLTLSQYMMDPITYYSEVLFHSMKGIGTDDERLIRTVLSRCEIDLQTVKERFEKLHQRTLDKAIKKETSGDYEKIMLALVSAQ